MDEKDVISLVEANLSWAQSIAAGYASSIRHVEVNDIKQEAALALTLAAKTFDPSRSVPFQAYARRCITNRLDSLYRVGQKTIAHEQAMSDAAAPFDPQAEADSDSVNDEFPSHVADAATEAHCDEVRQALVAGAANLTPNQREILTAFASGASYQEIASGLGSSRQAVQQAANRAWAQMRAALEQKGHRNAAFMPKIDRPSRMPRQTIYVLVFIGAIILALALVALWR